MSSKNATIAIAGLNDCSQLLIPSKTAPPINQNIIDPPIEITAKVSQWSSYSTYSSHSVIVKNDGYAFAIGINNINNIGKVISDNFPDSVKEWTNIEMTDDNGKKISFISAVCGSTYTLYLVKYPDSDELPFLAYVQQGKKDGHPFFLDTGDMNILGIFGGRANSAAIDETGSLILITQTIISDTNLRPIIAILPNDEKAVQVACLHNSYVALSSTGNVFELDLQDRKNNIPIFTKLKISISGPFCRVAGTWEHCFALTTKGKVYGFGANHFGHLGKGKNRQKTADFELIKTFNKCQIKDVYAGSFHSLFICTNGNLLACGRNKNGELMTNVKSKDCEMFKPVNTIFNNSEFCIAGINTSVVFLTGKPPPNTPNQVIDSELFLQEDPASFALDNASFNISKIRTILNMKASLEVHLNEATKYCKKIKKAQNAVTKLNDQIDRLKMKIQLMSNNNRYATDNDENEEEEDNFDYFGDGGNNDDEDRNDNDNEMEDDFNESDDFDENEEEEEDNNNNYSNVKINENNDNYNNNRIKIKEKDNDFEDEEDEVEDF